MSLDTLMQTLFDERVERIILPNGLTVIVKPDAASNLVSAQVWVKTGSIHEGSLLGSGLSHYVEHMLFKGTERRTHKAITDDIQSHGGTINAYTTFDRTVYYVDAPSESLEPVLDVLEDIVFHSVFHETEVDSERSVIQREIDMGRDDPDRKLQIHLFETAYQTHPYRYPVIGHRELFDAITRDQLFNYYKGAYVPNNMVLVIVGNVDVSACMTHVEALFGKHPRACTGPIVPTVESGQLAPRTCRLKGDYQLTYGSITYKIPGLKSKDAPAVDLLALILGHGKSARLWQRLREEEELVHHIDASSWNPGETGLLWVGYVCDPDKRDAVESAVASVMEDFIQSGPTELELDRARRQLAVGEVNVRKTMSGQASRLGTAEVVVGDLAYPRYYFDRLAKVTLADVQSVARKYCISEGKTSASLAPDLANEPSSDSAIPQGLKDFSEHRLSSGMRVLLQPDARLPKVHLRLAGLGGPLYESSGSRGFTSLTSSLLTKAAGNRSSKEVAETIESLGGTLGEVSGNNSFGLYTEVLSEDFPAALDIIKNALLAPAFKADDLHREREAQIATIKEAEDDILDHAIRRARELLFEGHPYAQGSLGTVEDLKSVDEDSIRSHYVRLLAADNLIVAVSGDFDEATMLAELEAAFASVPQDAFEACDVPASPLLAPVERTFSMDREQAVVVQAFPGIGVKSEHYYVEEVLDELLSGMSSHLFESVREQRGLAYYVGSSRMLGLTSGMFYLYSGTEPAHAHEVAQTMEEELARIASGNVTEEELSRVRTHLKARKRMSLQAPGSRAGQAVLNALYGLPINEWREYDAKVDAVSREAIQAYTKDHCNPRSRVQVLINAKPSSGAN
ncbi:MAG: pitrilysin family protein [Opitutales bacterium]